MADSSSANIAVLRPSTKPAPKKPPVVKQKESKTFNLRTRLREADSPTTVKPTGTKFRVLLIQEGLGNLRDCFYYTKECLKNSVALFEGIKCYADHPNQIEEQIHPERSTRDILGHYENVAYKEDAGRGCLEADFVLCQGSHFDWAKSLLTNALEYSTKYSNADFVGFSINAQGEASSAPILDFVDSNDIPDSAMPKLRDAMAQGIDEIRPVSILKNAVSVDMVTEAGAGGKILTMMEKNSMKPKKKEETKESKKVREGDAPPPKAAAPAPKPAPAAGPKDDGGQDDHADADQDKALFQKMIAQYLGPEHEENEDAMTMAKHAHEHYQSEGLEGHEAYEAAGKHLQASAAIGKAMAAKMQDQDDDKDGKEQPAAESEGESEGHHEAKEDESESHHEAEDEHEEAGKMPAGMMKHKQKKESAAPIAAAPKGNEGDDSMDEMNKGKLTATLAEVAQLRESVAVMKTERYLDKKLGGSDRSPEFIKSFREALGKPRSSAHIEETWAAFTKAYDAGRAEALDEESGVMLTEKGESVRESSSRGKVLSFADCAE